MFLNIPTTCAAANRTARLWQQMRRSPHAQRSYKKTPLKALSEPEQLQDQIRERAYELYESRGREDGHDLEDWLRAEEEIAREKVRSIAA